MVILLMLSQNYIQLMPMSEKKRINKPLIFLPLFIIVLIFSSCGDPEIDTLPPLKAPPEIAGIKISKSITGKPALKELHDLHGLSVGIVNGYVAKYSDGENEVTIYYSEAENIYTAEKIIEKMVAKISKGNKYFGGFKEKKLGESSIYSVTGMGQEHYFFRTGEKIIWIAGDFTAIENALSDYLVILSKEKMLNK